MNSLIQRLVNEKSFDQSINRFHDLALELGPESLVLPSNLDWGEFSRALSNIINNAIEATVDTADPRVRIKIIQHNNNYFKICVEDNGPGIPPTIVGKIGELGFSYGKRNGSGLGVHFARKVLQEAGGALEIYSCSTGSRVEMIVPQRF